MNEAPDQAQPERPRTGQAAAGALDLLSNAVKFAPPGGRVTVSLAGAGREAVVTVNDTGQGMSLDFTPHLFERFRQADPSTTRKHDGLGLAIVKQFVELHGGHVRARSPARARRSS